MKISFITTVYNEEAAIHTLLDSLFASSKLPEEIVIVDAKSTDNTLNIINEYIKETRSKVKIILIEKKCNRSQGRNIAIEHATGKIIVTSDVGCILDKKWLENIIEPFEKDSIDVASGYYYPITHSTFEKCLATYTCVMPDNIDENNFLPSSRSVAFTKAVWEEVKGYPENLSTCEDLVFASNLKKANKKFNFVKNAFVYWPQRKNIIEAAKQFFSYALGDGQAHYYRKNTPFLFGRYIIGFLILLFITYTQNIYALYIMLLLYVFYLLWAISKNYRYVNNWKALFYLPVLQITADICVLSGTIIGYVQSLL